MFGVVGFEEGNNVILVYYFVLIFYIDDYGVRVLFIDKCFGCFISLIIGVLKYWRIIDFYVKRGMIVGRKDMVDWLLLW